METQEYKVKAPDGQIIKLRGPAGASQDEVIAQAQKLYGQKQAQQPAPDQGGAPTPSGQPVAPAVNEDLPIMDAAGNVSYPPVQGNAPAPDNSIASKAVGTGETALSLATGLTGGALGMIGGTVGGAIDEIASGNFGTQDAADRIEKRAMEGSSALTYAPRTQSGREQTQAVGEALAPLAALGPMVSETAAISQGLKNVAPMIRAARAGRAAEEVAPAAAQAEVPGATIGRGSAQEIPSQIQPEIQRTAPAAEQAAQAAPQQTVEGLAKNITEATKAEGKTKIPTMERLADEVRPDETILQAADRLGIKDQLIPSQYSKSQAYREIEQGLASIPGSQLNAQQKAATAMLAQKADDMIQQYGGNIDKAALSTDFKNRGMALVDDLSKQADDLYDKVREAIPVTTKITADSTVGYLTNKAKELGGAEALSPIERRTLSMLSGGGKQVPMDPNSPQSLATFGQATEYQRNLPTYARVDLLRRQVGEGTRGRGPFKDADSGTLKQLYAKLSDDQQAAAVQNGAGELFSAAKQVVTRRKAIEDDLIGVLGKDLSGVLTAKTGNAIRSLATGNYKDFDNIMSKIPKDQQQRVVMTSLNDALTAGSRMEKQLSAPGFTDWYEGLKRNNTARRRLYQYMPKEARRTLDDIAKVAKGMRDANKERITTGRIQALMDNFANEGGMLSKLYGVGKDVAMAEGAGHVVGLPGVGAASVIVRAMSKTKTPLMKAADDLLSSPQFKTVLNEYFQTGVSAKRAAALEAKLAKTPAYKKWLSHLTKAQKAAIESNGALTWLSQSVKSEEPADDNGKTNGSK